MHFQLPACQDSPRIVPIMTCTSRSKSDDSVMSARQWVPWWHRHRPLVNAHMLKHDQSTFRSRDHLEHPMPKIPTPNEWMQCHGSCLPGGRPPCMHLAGCLSDSFRKATLPWVCWLAPVQDLFVCLFNSNLSHCWRCPCRPEMSCRVAQ